MADYSQLPTLITDAKREALIAEMTCNEWDFEGDKFTKSQNYGESYASQSVTLDGQASGSSYNGGASNDNDTGLAQAALDEFNGVKSKWDGQIDELVAGWDHLDDPTKYDGMIGSMGAAIKKVAAGTGSDDSQLGNPDLTEIGFIRQRLAQNAGQTVEQFYRCYGPEKLELVLDGHCEVMASLGLAVAGQKEIWTKTRTDVATILEAGVAGFTQTRQNNDTDWKAVISVATAGIGVLSAFTAGVPGLAPILAAVSATGGFLGAAIDALPKTAEPKNEAYTGSHPDTVFSDLKKAFTVLETSINEQEVGHETMLDTMLAAVADTTNRGNFHIHAAAGLAPEFGGTDDIIDMKYPVLETIGYTSMPLIARAFLDSVDNAEAADDQTTWFRPYASVPAGAIGSGAYGPYYAWQGLYRAIFPLMNDTAAEVVRAGEHLAEAAGYVRDSDQWAKDALGKNYQDIQGADLGWQAPYTPPPPPAYPHGHNIPI
ncbi:hypothetical protein [Nocardioides sp.]|uniref:hypothetical protein n=1 Tax=Nocardioides sp. TaxID=35761 RepID=UPI00271A125C|nr:hypothetical protein [Nocardioides sp.]MDO9455565.1 hypothetical protein [Nocardioides sp.]